MSILENSWARIFTPVFKTGPNLASIGMLVTRDKVIPSELLIMMKMSRMKRMRLMFMKVEVPPQRYQSEKQQQQHSETCESGTGAERRATATEPLYAAATRSAATVTEPRNARDTAASAPLHPHRAAALDRSPLLPFLLSAFCFLSISLLYSYFTSA